jgi:DNA-binding MarR family transcriptional regulator
MSGVKDDFPDHALSLLGQVMDGLRRDMHDRTSRPGTPGMPASGRGLRSSQIRLLSLTPPDGMRVTDLAERVGMTKQALGEFANALEERGLLESLRDPADRRVRILRLTPDGRAAVTASERLIDEIEREWRQRVGPETWDALRAALLAVVAARRDD